MAAGDLAHLVSEKYVCVRALCNIWSVPSQDNNRLPLVFETAGRVSASVVSVPSHLPQVVHSAADSPGRPPSETAPQ